MAELYKVLKGMECCESGNACGICPYSKNNNCTMGCAQALRKDALKLLKSDCLVKVIRCKDCQMWRSPSEEDISDGITTGYCNNAGFGTEPFGFCSDAIRR